MRLNERKEISDSFEEAWEESFGSVFYIIPLDRSATNVNDIYGETVNKVYNAEEAIMFYATYKEESEEEISVGHGRDDYRDGVITFVKNTFVEKLKSKGVFGEKERYLDMTAILVNYDDLLEEKKYFNIIGNYGTVNLGGNKIFSKLDVVELDYRNKKTVLNEELLVWL